MFEKNLLFYTPWMLSFDVLPVVLTCIPKVSFSVRRNSDKNSVHVCPLTVWYESFGEIYFMDQLFFCIMWELIFVILKEWFFLLGIILHFQKSCFIELQHFSLQLTWKWHTEMFKKVISIPIVPHAPVWLIVPSDIFFCKHLSNYTCHVPRAISLFYFWTFCF